MKQLNTTVGIFGPFSIVTQGLDAWHCDDVVYPASVIGSATVQDYVAPPKPPVVVPVPQSVSPRQIRQALSRAGLRASVEAAVAAGDQDTKDWYEFATAFERSNPHILAMAQALGVTDAQLDGLFISAGTL